MAGGDALRFVSFRGACRSHDRDRGGIEMEVGNVLGVEVAWSEMKFNVVFDDAFNSLGDTTFTRKYSSADFLQ